jgi:Ni/Fe-hydrogenase 1 B-type cytochrome subunit
MSTRAPSQGHDIANIRPVYVFEAPVRIWHWVHTISILVLCVTGYFIAYPLPSIGGEASDHFLMGTFREIHFIAGYVFAIAFLVRIYWAFVGNRFARELFVLPIHKKEWWGDLIHEIKYYTFLTRKSHKILGHNPLAQSAMFFFNVIVVLFLIVTGFALYGEGLGQGSWADRLFGWTIPLLGGSLNTKMWHLTAMWILIVFVIIHVYMAIRADIMSRESSVSTIMGGWRMYKDDLP